MQKHYRSAHESRQGDSRQKDFQCEYPGCGETFKTEGFLNIHQGMKQHYQKEGLYTCEFCGQEFSNTTNKSIHKHKVHRSLLEQEELEGMEEDEEEFKICTFPVKGGRKCGKMYPDKGGLMRHKSMKNHYVAKGDFICDECGFRYPSKDKLQAHTETHFQETQIEPEEESYQPGRGQRMGRQEPSLVEGFDNLTTSDEAPTNYYSSEPYAPRSSNYPSASTSTYGHYMGQPEPPTYGSEDPSSFMPQAAHDPVQSSFSTGFQGSYQPQEYVDYPLSSRQQPFAPPGMQQMLPPQPNPYMSYVENQRQSAIQRQQAAAAALQEEHMTPQYPPGPDPQSQQEAPESRSNRGKRRHKDTGGSRARGKR